MNRLSHSAATKFQQCPKEYDFHYNLGLRTKYQSSALLFGTAIDKAFEALVADKDARATFDKTWAFQEVNKVLVPLPECIDIVYSDSEFDEDLLTEKHLLRLTKGYEELGFKGQGTLELYKDIKAKKKEVGYKNLSVNEKKYFNLANWCCLERKGHLMIDTLQIDVLPSLTKIIATQKKIELINETGDSIIGYVDIIAEYKGDIVVFDLKTSSIIYDEDSVLVSPQLSLYVHALSEEYKTRKAGFIVLNKRVVKNKTKKCSVCSHDGTGSRARKCDVEVEGKRCNGEWIEVIRPEIAIQIIVDEIPEQTENIVLDNMNNINESIKAGVFVRNLTSCIRPWGKCPFFGICYRNDFSDVIEVKKYA